MKKTTTRMLKIILIMAVILIAVFLLSDYFHSQKAADNQLTTETPQHTLVETATAEVRRLKYRLVCDGIASAERKAHLTFEVTGRVAEINTALLREGRELTVPAGRKLLLARLDDHDYREELLKAESSKTQSERSIDVAEASLQQYLSQQKLSEIRLRRFRKLLSSKTISRQKFDEVNSEYEVASAAVVSARARLSSARAALTAAVNTLSQSRRNLERTCIYAPFNSTVSRVNIETGDYVTESTLDNSTDSRMNATYPVTVIDRSKFKVELELPLSETDNIRAGCQAVIQSLRNTYASSELIPARVESIAPALSPQSRTVRVTLHTCKNNPALFDGELVQVEIICYERDTLSIPLSSLLYFENKPHVFTINNTSMEVSLTPVTTGIRDGENIEVIAPLKPEQLLVTTGKHRLLAGDRVRLLAQKDENIQ